MSAEKEDVGGYWLAPVRITEDMMTRMLEELDCDGTREDRENMLRNVWAEARFASPTGGKVAT